MAEQYDVILPEETEEHMYGLLKGLFVLSEPMIKRMEQENLLKLYAQIELPLSGLLAEMEYNGIKINTAYLQQLGCLLYTSRRHDWPNCSRQSQLIFS